MNESKYLTQRLSASTLEFGASILRSISHPIRLAILDYLDKEGSKTVTEIQAKLGLEQAATSHHLGLLRDRGVLQAERQGRQVYYTMRQEMVAQIVECLEKFQAQRAELEGGRA